MSDAVGRPDRPLEVTVPPEHAALLRGPGALTVDCSAAVACPWCGAPAGAPCKTMDGQILPIDRGAQFHSERVRRQPRGPALADAVADVVDCWASHSDAQRKGVGGGLARRLDALARAAGRDVP